MKTRPFIHLHLHTEYSLVDSTVRIAALMKKCASLGMPAVALTDQHNLFGLVKFYRKAIAAGVKPIIGVDLRIENDDEPDRPYTLLLLCQDNDGYRNLSQLITRSYLEGQVRGVPMIRREWLDANSCERFDRAVRRPARRYRPGVACRSPQASGETARWLAARLSDTFLS